jgi:hypothetical protein
MKQNQRDSLTHLGIALTSFGLWASGVFKINWQSNVMLAGMIIFLVLSIWEYCFPKMT